MTAKARAALLLLVLTIAFHWPVVKGILKNRLPFPSHPDSLYMLSIVASHLQALSHDPALLYHLNFYYPHAYVTFYGPPLFGQALFFYPFVKILNLPPATAYSLFLLTGFALSGLGAFLLAHYLTGSSEAALLAGFLAVSYPFARLYFIQIHIFSFFFSGFALLFLIGFLREGGWLRAAGLVLFLLLQGLFSIYHSFFFLAVLLPLLIAAGLLLKAFPAKRLAGLAVLLAACGLILLLIYHPLLKVSRASGLARPFSDKTLLDGSMLFSSNSALYRNLTGKRLFALFPGFVALLLFLASSASEVWEAAAFVILSLASFFLSAAGYGKTSSLLFLLLLGLFAWLSFKNRARIPVEIRWIQLLAVFYLLFFFRFSSLGLSFSPYRLLAELFPPFTGLRQLCRAVLTLSPALAAGAAAGLLWLQRRIKGKAALLALLIFLSAGENFYQKPFFSKVPLQKEKYSLIAREKGKVILELPAFCPPRDYLNTLYTVNTFLHFNFYVNGTGSFRLNPPQLCKRLAKQDFPQPQDLVWLLQEFSVDYLIFNWKMMPHLSRQKLLSKMDRLRKFASLLEDNPHYTILKLKENLPINRLERTLSLYQLKKYNLELKIEPEAEPEATLNGQKLEVKRKAKSIFVLSLPSKGLLQGNRLVITFNRPVSLKGLVLVRKNSAF